MARLRYRGPSGREILSPWCNPTAEMMGFRRWSVRPGGPGQGRVRGVRRPGTGVIVRVLVIEDDARILKALQRLFSEIYLRAR